MPTPPALPIATILLATAFAALPFEPGPSIVPFAVVEAEADDDDDDDDGGGGRSSGSSRQGGSDSGALPPRAGSGGLLDWLFDQPAGQPRRAAAPPPRPNAATGEIVVTGTDGLDRLLSEGFEVLGSTGDGPGRVVRLRVPRGLDVDTALRRVGELAPEATADRNHFYRPQDAACSAQVCAQWSEIGWQADGDRSCLDAVTVGVIDTGVNPDHEALAAARLELLTLREATEKASGLKHGTAVVSLLAGDRTSRVPGLVPQARIVAADPFSDAGGDERTDALGLVAAIDAVAANGARVVNMSLAGPDNRVLADRIRRLVEARTVVVAAAGNAGPRAAPLYPAAYDGVLAVTAVDSARRVYRRAAQGDHVDFAAPGVAVGSAASIRGVRPQTGTSFAAPFVTAAAAMLVAEEPDLTVEEVTARLAASAEDLGAEGRDPVFGYGMLRATGVCRAVATSGGSDLPVPVTAAPAPDQATVTTTTSPF